jgi:hypothetical protein
MRRLLLVLCELALVEVWDKAAVAARGDALRLRLDRLRAAAAA